MKKSLLFVLSFLFINILPVAAHDGEGDIITTGVAGSQNVTLLLVSTLLSLVMIGIIYKIASNPWTAWQWGIVSLGSLTAFAHLGFGLRGDALLILNGLGYLSLLLLLMLPITSFVAHQSKLYWVLIVYTAVTLLGYFATHDLGVYGRTELLVKGIEVGFLICLVVQGREERRAIHQSTITA